jgi:hypothetical protein
MKKANWIMLVIDGKPKRTVKSFGDMRLALEKA